MRERERERDKGDHRIHIRMATPFCSYYAFSFMVGSEQFISSHFASYLIYVGEIQNRVKTRNSVSAGLHTRNLSKRRVHSAGGAREQS
jgi:hypothetical protein